MLNAIDLFCGCGGLSLGLRWAGFRVLAAIDNDPHAISTYRLNNRRTRVLLKDIKEIDPIGLMTELGLAPGELGILAGCPPCQGFSTLRTLNGGRVIQEPKNDLVFQFLRFIEAFQPKAIMLENVPGLASDQRLVRLRRELEKMKYFCAIGVFDAANFGIAQRRKRMIFIGSTVGKPEFAKARNQSRTVKGAISRLPKPENSNDLFHNYTVIRQTRILKLIKRIPKNGGSRTDLPTSQQLDCHKRCDGFKDVYGRMAWDDPSPTITGGCISPSKGRFLHPDQDRAITLREAAILQGFPLSYEFVMPKGRYSFAQIIGNAFPPKFAEHHARKIRQLLETTEIVNPSTEK